MGADNIRMVRNRVSLVVLTVFALLAVSCGEGAADPEIRIQETSEAVTAHDVAPVRDIAPMTDAVPDDRPLWKGFAATHSPANLVAYTWEAVDVYANPGEAEPKMTIDPTTILGTVTVLGVVGQPEDGWVEVMLPTRPNGSTGWVESDAVSFYVADGTIVIDLTERTLTYSIDGVEVLSTEVGIGSRYNETPTGVFFVTDNVTLANPSSVWGPHALGLSARSDTITEYNGGDGIIGIHGTNNPDSIGGNISLGCVRLPNDMITLLHQMVPIGTRVEVQA